MLTHKIVSAKKWKWRNISYCDVIAVIQFLYELNKMRDSMNNWLNRYFPQPNIGDSSEQVRACLGMLLGLFLTGLLSYALLGDIKVVFYLMAPMGASAVLVFCMPSSPLAQPWSVIGGHFIAALIGVSCLKLFGDSIFVASLAGCLALGAMFLLRCLHPPSGSVALMAVLGGPAVHAAGYQFAFMPVGINSILLVVTALLFNNLTGRRYPHIQHFNHQGVHDTKDNVPTERLGFTSDDLDAVLKSYNEVLDISRDDLETIFLQTEMRAYHRRFGALSCADIMSKDGVTLVSDSKLEEAWQLMRRHRLHALPVLDSERRVIGMITQADFFEHIHFDQRSAMSEVLLRFFGGSRNKNAHSKKTVGQIMTSPVKTARDTTAIVELVPLMADLGLHHIPVVNDDGRFVGIVTQSDLVAALYEIRLAA